MGVTHAQYDGQKGQVKMVQAKWATTWINEGKFSWWPQDPIQQHLGGVSRHDYSRTMQSHHNPWTWCSWKGACINTFHYGSTNPFDEGQPSSHQRQSCSKEEPNGQKEWLLNCLNWDASMVCVTIRLWTFNFLSKMEEHPNHESWLGCYNVINSNLVSKLSNMVEANTLWIWEDAHGYLW